jgi:hypothetical protein
MSDSSNQADTPCPLCSGLNIENKETHFECAECGTRWPKEDL